MQHLVINVDSARETILAKNSKLFYRLVVERQLQWRCVFYSNQPPATARAVHSGSAMDDDDISFDERKKRRLSTGLVLKGSAVNVLPVRCGASCSACFRFWNYIRATKQSRAAAHSQPIWMRMMTKRRRSSCARRKRLVARPLSGMTILFSA